MHQSFKAIGFRYVLKLVSLDLNGVGFRNIYCYDVLKHHSSEPLFFLCFYLKCSFELYIFSEKHNICNGIE